METAILDTWLSKLGYADEGPSLYRHGDTVPENHPFASEIKVLLRLSDPIRARAVFEVEGTPAVTFLASSEDRPLSSDELDDIRKRIWNQNLVNIVVEITGDRATALPARKLNATEHLRLADARPDGPFSAIDIISANLCRRLPEWFDVASRVDRALLNNLSTTVAKISKGGLSSETLRSTNARRQAELLMEQVLFISYLEHRDIVGATYRQRRNVNRLHTLVSHTRRAGLRRLIDCLRRDFNGDFLGDDRHEPWEALTEAGFQILDNFLGRTDMRTGQGNFWNYDFSYIPVELLSGLYESFLSSSEQASAAAYYTPRHLATLAVDQALAASDDPLSDRIFDGACGSGILLTTVYRRLISLAETRRQRQLSFRERGDLLVQQIFGADTDPMACRVTAFSLYLSLLEGIDPADILEAQERDNTTLPSLAGQNLLHGDTADFFVANHGFAGQRFSLVISNPPWREPRAKERTTADEWAERAEMPFARRQVAVAFSLRAIEFLGENGRMCMILPIAQFLAPSSASFVSRFFRAIQPIRLINFGDLQDLLFPTTEHTCHVFVGQLRRPCARSTIPFGETFDYCVPKADMSLTFGRLTMQSGDRHALSTASVADHPQALVTLMWGDSNDLALWTRLSMRGLLGDLWKGPRDKGRWTCRKGVHFRDSSRSVSAAPLHGKPFVPIAVLRSSAPVLDPVVMTTWPASQDTVANLDAALWRVFDGPRVLFPDGFSRQEQFIRSAYLDIPATFSSSVGVIAGPREDADVLRFVAAYLRSTLAQYLLVIRCWTMLCERNAVRLADIAQFPFFLPHEAPNPDVARVALARVAEHMMKLGTQPSPEQSRRYASLRETFDESIFDYFGLTMMERLLVRETVNSLMPSIRPRSYTRLDTELQRPADNDDFETYARTLGDWLTVWRERTDGEGRFHVEVITSDPRQVGPLGIVRIEYRDGAIAGPTASARTDDDVVRTTLAELRKVGLTVVPSNGLQLVPDAHIWFGGKIYLVRLFTCRNWTIRQAVRDAERIFRDVQGRQRVAGREDTWI